MKHSMAADPHSAGTTRLCSEHLTFIHLTLGGELRKPDRESGKPVTTRLGWGWEEQVRKGAGTW